MPLLAGRIAGLAVLLLLAATPGYLVIDIGRLIVDLMTTQTDGDVILARAAEARRDRPALERSARDLDGAAGRLQGLVQEASFALAAAGIESEVRRLILADAGDVRSTQESPPVPEHGFERVAVSFDLTIASQNLPLLLADLERHVPYYLVDRLDVQRTGGADADMLNVRLGLHAYRRPGA